MSLSHQDWTPVVLKSKKKPIGIKRNQMPVSLEKKYNAGKNSQQKTVNAKKIEENEEVEIPKIPHEFKIQIQQARQKKKMTQRQLALECNIPETVIRDYELGKCLPNSSHLSKIGKILGVNLSIKNKK